MHAIYIERSGGYDVLQVREVEAPRPKPGEIAIAVKAAGVNFADILARQGIYPDAPPTPCVAGRRGARAPGAARQHRQGPAGTLTVRMTRTRWLVVAVFVALVAAFFAFDLGRYLSLEQLKAQREALLAYRDANALALGAGFFLVYVAVTGLSLPGAAIMTLAAGAVFGLVWGTVIVSFASSIGATLAMLVARFVLGDAVQARYADRLRAINEGMRKDGPFYLFTLRLVPAFPFFLINLTMGLVPIRTWTFYWVSQVGMLPGTIVYVLAGTELGKLTSLSGILSPTLIGSFVLLGLFPLIARKTLEKINARRAKNLQEAG